jgi:hypothetical protein
VDKHGVAFVVRLRTRRRKPDEDVERRRSFREGRDTNERLTLELIAAQRVADLSADERGERLLAARLRARSRDEQAGRALVGREATVDDIDVVAGRHVLGCGRPR